MFFRLGSRTLQGALFRFLKTTPKRGVTCYASTLKTKIKSRLKNGLLKQKSPCFAGAFKFYKLPAAALPASGS